MMEEGQLVCVVIEDHVVGKDVEALGGYEVYGRVAEVGDRHVILHTWHSLDGEDQNECAVVLKHAITKWFLLGRQEPKRG